MPLLPNIRSIPKTLFSSNLRLSIFLPYVLLAFIIGVLAIYAVAPRGKHDLEEAVDPILVRRSEAAESKLKEGLAQFQRETEVIYVALTPALVSEESRGVLDSDRGPESQHLPESDTPRDLLQIVAEMAQSAAVIQHVQLVGDRGQILEKNDKGPYSGGENQRAILVDKLQAVDSLELVHTHDLADISLPLFLLPGQNQQWVAIVLPVGKYGTEFDSGYLLFTTSLVRLFETAGYEAWIYSALLDSEANFVGQNIAPEPMHPDFSDFITSSGPSEQEAYYLQTISLKPLQVSDRNSPLSALPQSLGTVLGRPARWLVRPLRMGPLSATGYLVLGYPLSTASTQRFPTLPILFNLILAVGLLTVAYGLWRSWRTALVVEQTVNQAEEIVSTNFGHALPVAERDEIQQLGTIIDYLATALEESLSKLHSRIAHLKLLYEATEQFNADLSLTGAIGVTIETIWQATQIDYMAIVLGDNELGPFRYAGIRGVDEPLRFLGDECPFPLWGVLAQTLVNAPDKDSRDHLLIEDIEMENRPLPEEFPWIPAQGAMMIVPLRSLDETFGAIILCSKQPYYFSDTGLRDYFHAVATNAARAIQDAQSREQTTRWINQLVSLQLLTKTITGSQNLDTILSALSTEITEMFGQAAVQIILQAGPEEQSLDRIDFPIDALRRSVQDDEPDLEFYTVQDLSTQEQQLLQSPEVQELVRWVVEAGQPLFYDPSEPISDALDLYYREKGRALLVPIVNEEESSLGVIHISAPARERPFDENDMVIMRTIANSTAIAIGNVRLYQQLLRTRYNGAKLLVDTVAARFYGDVEHNERVAHNAERMAAELALPEATRQAIHVAGMLHDIGRTHHAQSMDTHTEAVRHGLHGATILERMDFASDIVEIVAQHCLPLDGTTVQAEVADWKYFDEQNGLSIGARIVAVASTADHICCLHAGDQAEMQSACTDRLHALSGSVLDPEVVSLYVQLLEQGLLQIPEFSHPNVPMAPSYTRHLVREG